MDGNLKKEIVFGSLFNSTQHYIASLIGVIVIVIVSTFRDQSAVYQSHAALNLLLLQSNSACFENIIIIYPVN